MKVGWRRGGMALGYHEVIDLWRTDDGFRSRFNETLSAAPFEAFFWETPPVSLAYLGRAFEFVLVDAPALAGVAADTFSFRRHFEDAKREDVVVFDNLGGDARLIAPCPRGEEKIYPHLATFVRNAPEEQRQQLWRQVGESLHEAMASEPIWLSTSGLGVFWVHVRLDRRPKYYTFAPYRLFNEV